MMRALTWGCLPSWAEAPSLPRIGGPMKLFLKTIDSLSEWSGKSFSWLVLILTGTLVIEVIARYVFKNPTIFAFDMTWMIFGIYTIMGAAYTHLGGGHVRIDFLYSRLPIRNRAILELVLYLIFFFPLILVLAISCTEFTILSWASDERSSTSLWKPPVYPFKTAMMVGFYLLALQGTAQFIKNLQMVIRGKP